MFRRRMFRRRMFFPPSLRSEGLDLVHVDYRVLSAFVLKCPFDWTVDVLRNNQFQEPWSQLLVDGDAGLLPDSDANTLIIIRLATIRDTWLAVHNWSCSQRTRSEYGSGGGLLVLSK
jgi:hypothetical protein